MDKFDEFRKSDNQDRRISTLGNNSNSSNFSNSIDYIKDPGNAPIGSVRTNTNRGMVYDENNEYTGYVSEQGTYDKTGWRISTIPVIGLLLKILGR